MATATLVANKRVSDLLGSTDRWMEYTIDGRWMTVGEMDLESFSSTVVMLAEADVTAVAALDTDGYVQRAWIDAGEILLPPPVAKDTEVVGDDPPWLAGCRRIERRLGLDVEPAAIEVRSVAA